MSFGFSIGDFLAVIQLANKIRKDFVGAPSQLKNISDELRSLAIVVQDAEVVVSECELNDRQKTNLGEVTGSCRNVLLELDKILDKYSNLPTRGGSLGQRVKRVWKRLELEPEDIRQLRDRLTSNVTLLSTCIAQVSNTATFAAMKGIDLLNQRQDDQDRRAVLDWLTPIDYAAQQSDFINRRQPGTGQWLLDSPEFQTWLQADGRTLFCPGIPGAGKTILTSIVVDELTSRFADNDAVGIAYVYCNFRRTDEQQADDLIASLVKQLSQRRPTLPESVKSLYDQHSRQWTRPSFDKLSNVLRSVTAAYTNAFIIVDALDECQTKDGCRELFLTEMFNLAATSGVHLFATSRFIPEITARYHGMTQLEIRARSEDVRRYVDGHTSRLPSFVGRSSSFTEEVIIEIVRATDGMFLLAKLHLASLIGKRSPKALRTALAKLPSGSDAYNDAYENAMERIEGQLADQEELAKQVLSWITCAQRPLTTTEIRHALAVELGESALDEENLPQLEDVVSVCAGLVTVDEQSGIIRLVHYTTQEYFRRTRNDWFPNAETDITRTCVTYLSYAVFGSGFCESDDELEQRLLLCPLYHYAARNWGHHARYATTLSREVIDFLQCKAKVEASSQALMAVKNWGGPSSYRFYSQEKSRQTSGPHLAAVFGFEEGLKALFWEGVYTDSRRNDGRTPLSLAAENGYDTVAKLLLDTGKVDADSRDIYGRTPLSLAAKIGYDTVAKLLLDTGKVDADSRDSDGWTPLLWAAWGGHEAVAKLLLDTGTVDTDSESTRGQTPLSLAAEEGHEAIAKLLLDTGTVDADSGDTRSWTPLLLAASNGHEAVVKLLLDTGKADINFRDAYGRIPLSWAAKNGHEAVVKLLLNTGKTDIDLRDSDGRTPLSWAAKYGHEAVVKLLLNTGKADIDFRDSDGRTPLSWAAENGHEAIVKLLLDAGKADIDFRNAYSRTPLYLAAENGHEAVVKLLLDTGKADIDFGDASNRTPLSRAAENGYEAVVKMLLDTGKVNPG